MVLSFVACWSINIGVIFVRICIVLGHHVCSYFSNELVTLLDVFLLVDPPVIFLEGTSLTTVLTGMLVAATAVALSLLGELAKG